ncbi:ABC transporter ATP-binding protein [Methanomethylovorans sp.]|uniref:ABC transporter ATP-binding protein n=1 Tax=Methanomethylovorans sp. TaxID=2758717 RepID=UPI00345ED17F
MFKKFNAKQVLEDVNFDIRPGETLGLCGKSGSGKTTVGRCIVGLEIPDSGEILFGGVDHLSKGKMGSSIMGTGIQMIFQHPETSLDPRMKGLDSIIEPLKIHNKCTREQMYDKAMELADMVGLSMEHLNRYPSQLSGGEIQRIVLARILSIEPQLIVADEPTSMLDVSVQAQVMRLMQRIQEEKGISYLLISHDIELLYQVCDRIAYLEAGRIVKMEEI